MYHCYVSQLSSVTKRVSQLSLSQLSLSQLSMSQLSVSQLSGHQSKRVLTIKIKESYLFDVPDVPDVDGVVVVDNGDLEVALVVGDGGGVGVARRGRVRGHVADVQPLGHVHTIKKITKQ